MSFYESSGYWEVPVSDRYSVVASPWIEQSYETEEGWRAEAVIGVKRAILRGDSGALAIQAGALWQSLPNEGCDEGGAELRFLGGVNFGRTGFVNAEIAERALNGGCGGERLDLTAGFRPAENWLAMGQVFMDTPRDGDTSVKAQFSIVRFGGKERGLQLGVRARLDGDDPEPALVLGLWGRPGD